MSDAGLRISEAAALRWRDVLDAEDGAELIYIKRSKTDQTGPLTTIQAHPEEVRIWRITASLRINESLDVNTVLQGPCPKTPASARKVRALTIFRARPVLYQNGAEDNTRPVSYRSLAAGNCNRSANNQGQSMRVIRMMISWRSTAWVQMQSTTAARTQPMAPGVHSDRVAGSPTSAGLGLSVKG